MKKKLLIVSHIQFGYLTEVLFYCRDLKSDYKITYIGFDFGMKKILPPSDVEVIYVDRHQNKLYNYIKFIKQTIKLIANDGFNVCLIFYFTSCSLIRIFAPLSNIVVDIRTSFIFRNTFKRYFLNFLLWLECLFFKNITIISEGLATYLHLLRKTHVVPLGGEVSSSSKKSFSSINILYVGTFYERKIEETIGGVAKFIEEFPEIDVCYSIIGYGPTEKIRLINEEINIYKEASKSKINFLGEIRYPELQEYFDKYNVGICYVPMESYYDFQPPTKTFEYLLGGMVVVATNTFENRKVINAENGVLIDHTTDGIYQSLKQIASLREVYDLDKIRADAMKYTWSQIINNNLKPYLLNLGS